MKNRTASILVVIALMSGILACSVNLGGGGNNIIRGSGKMATQTRDVNSITSVELATIGTLHISQGKSESLTIKAEENLLDYIQTDVSLGKLEISTKPGTNLDPTKPIDYVLTVTDLSAISTSSDGDVDAASFKSDSFSVAVSSSGSVNVGSIDCTTMQVKSSSSGNITIGNLTANSITLTISSSGNVEIQNGQVPQQNIKLSSSGEYRANNLASANADVTISSSGSATIRVSDQLTGELSSSGNVNYIGNPTVNVSVNSSGAAIQINQ